MQLVGLLAELAVSDNMNLLNAIRMIAGKIGALPDLVNQTVAEERFEISVDRHEIDLWRVLRVLELFEYLPRG